MKTKTAVSIDLDLLRWTEAEVKKGRFANKSHGLSYCMRLVRDRKIA